MFAVVARFGGISGWTEPFLDLGSRLSWLTAKRAFDAGRLCISSSDMHGFILFPGHDVKQCENMVNEKYLMRGLEMMFD